MTSSPDLALLAERVRRIPTTIACDILKDHGLAERVAFGLSAVTPGAVMAGPVRIIEFLPGRPEIRRLGPPANFAVVDALCPGEVLVLCAGGALHGAVLGDMLATRAQSRGAGGAVVDGAVRDLDGLALSGLPVQARGVAPMAAHASLIPFACQRPVRFVGITVMPDDWVLADRDGVMFLPPELVHILLAGEDLAKERDAFSQQLLLMGFALTDVFPLPNCLAPFLDNFRHDGTVPPQEDLRRALTQVGASKS